MCDRTGEEWIVRLERRSDGRIYYFDRNGNVNARERSALTMSRADAVQLARAIRNNHRTLSAHAMRFINTKNGTKKEVLDD